MRTQSFDYQFLTNQDESLDSYLALEEKWDEEKAKNLQDRRWRKLNKRNFRIYDKLNSFKKT